MVSIKILRGTAVFNIDNNKKCFLSTKSVYYDVALKTEIMSAENHLCLHRNILYLKNILKTNKKYHFKLQFHFHFWSNKWRRGEHKRLFKQKNLTYTKLLNDNAIFVIDLHFISKKKNVSLGMQNNKCNQASITGWESARSLNVPFFPISFL